MALAQSLNGPMNDPIGALGGVLREPSVQKRGAKARELTEPLMRAESEARTDLEKTKAAARKEQITKEEGLQKTFVTGLTQAQTAYESELGQQPERTITAFNPERATELAVLTAIMGAFAGSISGRAGLSAMKGVSEGYRTGQEDLYKREVNNYEAALGQYKQKIAEAKQIYDNAVKLETEERGRGMIELKKLDPLLQDSVITAHAKVQNLKGVGDSLREAIKLATQLDLSYSQSGMKPQTIKTGVVLDRNGQSWLVNLGQFIAGTEPTEGAVGVIGRSATGAQAAAKTAAVGVQQQEGQRRFQIILNALDEIYKDLRTKGAITDTQKSVTQNVISYALTTSPLQAVQRAGGGEAQALRDRIQAQRANLIQSIMQATGMSARSLDSNKELEFYLQAATDPTKSYQANISALETLRSLYGRLKDNTYPEDVQEMVINRYGAYEPQKYKYEITPDNRVTRIDLPSVVPTTRSATPSTAPVDGFDDAKRSRLEELRAKQRAGTLGQ